LADWSSLDKLIKTGPQLIYVMVENLMGSLIIIRFGDGPFGIGSGKTHLRVPKDAVEDALATLVGLAERQPR